MGGADLVDDACAEAFWYAALYFPWDGDGDEPLDRMCARVRILTERIDRARALRTTPHGNALVGGSGS
jgi:hypothetical protein